MKFSENWLRSLVNIEVASTQLHEQITMLGLEVDDILPVAGTFDQVVVGEVVSANQHPNADKLRVTKVNIGQDELVDIVCGAPNCRTGIKVAVALVGATLPGEFKIKSAKLRGEPSEGMLCSYSELGISDDHNGIIELPLDAPIGMDLRKYLDLDDNIIEISVTPNRADANSLLGISRDVAAYYNVPISMPKIDKTVATISDTKIINLLAPEACPIYLGRIIKNIDMTASTPVWLKERLRRSGIRSIDPIVDITNYVLIELGQPMHAFDFDSLEGSINVRLALENETITLLDGNQVKLDKDVLVIADDKKALAMAGIFGGLDSGVTSKTRSIFLESAFFSPLAITGRARRYGLHTDASYRYERGVDPKLAAIAMDRATQLITEICGGEVSDILTAVDETKTPTQQLITLRYERLEKLLGYTIDSSLIAPILTRLGCEVSSITSDAHAIAWQVKAPSWRFDMSIEEDLIEEVARIHGYDKIQSANILSELVIRNQPESTLKLENAKQTLINRGYFEAITYSFVDPKIQSLIHPNEASEILPHPISVEMSAMRLSLLPGLLTTAQYNQNRQQTRLRLFEFGLCFIPDANEELKVKQKPVLAGVLTGMRYPEHWSFDKSHADYFDAKGDVEAILSLTGRKDEVRFEVSTKSFLHPGQSAEIFIGENQVGFVGVLHPLLEKKLDLNSKTMVFQLDWECINNCIIPSPQELSKFPANRRDIAIIVNKCVSSQKILQICKDVGEKQLVDVNLFDVYDGKGIAEGDKSLAISLVLQERHRTLTEEEISETVNACIMALKQQVAASLRE